jgi:hypothetical protein
VVNSGRLSSLSMRTTSRPRIGNTRGCSKCLNLAVVNSKLPPATNYLGLISTIENLAKDAVSESLCDCLHAHLISHEYESPQRFIGTRHRTKALGPRDQSLESNTRLSFIESRFSKRTLICYYMVELRLCWPLVEIPANLSPRLRPCPQH